MNQMDKYRAYMTARQAAEQFLIAYSRHDDYPYSSYYLESGTDELRKLAAQLGFRLMPVEDAKSELVA